MYIEIGFTLTYLFIPDIVFPADSMCQSIPILVAFVHFFCLWVIGHISLP